MIFLERRMVIDVLYKNIRQKDKVLTSRRVVGFEMGENGVSVQCQDGSVHRGSILIGADGIRSTVSRQMSHLNGRSKKGKYAFRTSPVALIMLSMLRYVLFGAPCLLEVMCIVTSKPPNLTVWRYDPCSMACSFPRKSLNASELRLPSIDVGPRGGPKNSRTML